MSGEVFYGRTDGQTTDGGEKETGRPRMGMKFYQAKWSRWKVEVHETNCSQLGAGV